MKKLVKLSQLFLVYMTLATTAVYGKTIELSGSVISDNEKYITSRFMGFIKTLNVTEGDIVQKGELLYSIDSSEIDSKKRQATLSTQMYENQYTIMQRNFERYQRLFEKGLVSKFELEQFELGSKNLKDMVKISKLQVEEIENQYQYLSIKAPNDGVIIKKNIKAGEMAIPGMPALVLSDLSSLKIMSEISERDLQNIFVNQKATVEIPSMNVTTKAKITAIIPSSNPMTHTFTIKLSFEDTKNIYPGMYAKITIELQEK